MWLYSDCTDWDYLVGKSALVGDSVPDDGCYVDAGRWYSEGYAAVVVIGG